MIQIQIINFIPSTNIMKDLKVARKFLLMIILVCLASAQSSIPTISLENNVLNAQTNYIMSYYTLRAFQTSSYFQLDFTQSDITVPDGVLNSTATINGTTINQSLIQSNCTNRVCIIRLGTSFALNTNVVVSFGQLTNPRYTATQRITVFVFFANNSN